MGSRQLTKWLIPLPAILFAIIPQTANAEPQPGLATTYYTIDEIPPLRSTSEYPICGTETENNINRSYDGEPFEDCTGDLFMVHMTGYITIPEHTTIEFMLATDDGGYADIGGNEFESWNDQGCTWIPSGQLEIEVGVQPLDVWMYENGGSSCIMLAWNIDDAGWAIVPDEAFTQTPTPTTTIPETTTTSEPTTTVPETTVPETTIPETTIPETTVPQTTVPETTTTTTTQAPPPETTTTTVYVPPATTTSSTTTTEAPPPTTTVPETTTTEPPTTLPQTTSSSTTIPRTTVPPTTTTPETTTTQTTPTTQPQPQPTQPETVPSLQVTTDATPQQILTAIQQLDPTQAEETFTQLDVTILDEEQKEALVAAIQNAPEEIRETFEDKVDIFKEGLDDYIPTGSNIPVGERRALIAIGAALTAAAATRIRR